MSLNAPPFAPLETSEVISGTIIQAIDEEGDRD